MTRVLYANHTSRVGGAELSLLELVHALPSTVEAVVATPHGQLLDAAAEAGLRTVAIRPFEVGFGGGRPVRSASVLARAAMSLRRSIDETQAELVHANSVRAGLVALAATRTGSPPVVVHVRDCLPRSSAARLVARAIRRRASVIVANSRYTARAFGISDADGNVVYPTVDVARFDPRRLRQSEARTLLDLPEDVPLLGVLGQLTAWKGQLVAIRTLARLREAGIGAELVLAGTVKFQSRRWGNATYLAELRREASELGVASAVHFVGEQHDVPTLLRTLDLLLVPSSEEPLGRVVLEGMATGLPVLATSAGGPPELIADGVDGLLVPPGDPARWSAAAADLLADPARRSALGTAARRKAVAGFGLPDPIATTLGVYATALADTRRRRTSSRAATAAPGRS